MSENGFNEEKNGLSIASLVLGIIGLLLSCVPIIGPAAAILAIIFGGISLHNKEGSEGMSIAGLVLGILALLGWVILIILGFAVLGFTSAALTTVPTAVTP
ncbi:MAG: hypothetical protein Q4Q04_02825 [Methanocorpusculum sp.]|nr:hypothetical protein [Methanocorpusculum sp.]